MLQRANSTWWTYAYWFFWISVVFFTVYPACNWLTAQRGMTFDLYVEAELSIPFIPEFVWAYLSLYIIFFVPPFLLKPARMDVLGKQLVAATIFCGIIFLLFPAQLGFERSVPVDPFYRSIFANLFAVDLPHNMVPSLHVAFSSLILFTVIDVQRTILPKIIFGTWLVLVCASTVFVHQHHLLDVVTGLLVAAAFIRFIGKGERHA